jgi:hypothetical protein
MNDIKEDRHCFSCGKTFKRPSEYERHKNRKTPCLIQDVPDNDIVENRCKFCNRPYKHASNLSRHYQKCAIKNGGMDILAIKVKREEDIEQKNKINMMIEKMENLEKIMKDQAQTIEKLSNNIVNNIVNSNNTTNIQNNIVINSYKDPNTDGLVLSSKDIDSHVKIAYALIDKIYFNPERPENHSIYLMNKKDKTLLVYKSSDLNKSEQWHTLTSERDRYMLVTELQNIIIQKGVKIVNSMYSEDKDKFLKLPKDLAERIINYNGCEHTEAKVNEHHLLDSALKHKFMVSKTIKNTKQTPLRSCPL